MLASTQSHSLRAPIPPRGNRSSTAVPDAGAAAAQGENAFFWIMKVTLPGWLAAVLYAGIILAQYLCGLAPVFTISAVASRVLLEQGGHALLQIARAQSQYRLRGLYRAHDDNTEQKNDRYERDQYAEYVGQHESRSMSTASGRLSARTRDRTRWQ